MTPASLRGFVYLIVFGSIVGYSSYVYALEHLPALRQRVLDQEVNHDPSAHQ